MLILNIRIALFPNKAKIIRFLIRISLPWQIFTCMALLNITEVYQKLSFHLIINAYALYSWEHNHIWKWAHVRDLRYLSFDFIPDLHKGTLLVTSLTAQPQPLWNEPTVLGALTDSAFQSKYVTPHPSLGEEAPEANAPKQKCSSYY